MIQGTQIRSFTLYPLEAVQCAAKCCFESESTKIICTIKGPDYTSKSLSTSFNIKIEGYQPSPSLLAFLERLLYSTVVLDTYEKASFTYEISVLKCSSNIFSELLNLMCYTTCEADIPLKEMFIGVVIGLVGENIILDPTPEVLSTARVVVEFGYYPSRNKMIHFELQGKASNNEIKKILGLGIGGCKTILNFIEQKVTEKRRKP